MPQPSWISMDPAMTSISVVEFEVGASPVRFIGRSQVKFWCACKVNFELLEASLCKITCLVKSISWVVLLRLAGSCAWNTDNKNKINAAMQSSVMGHNSFCQICSCREV